MNVVFDLGGVVLTWDPRAIVSSVFDDPAVRALVLERVFGDPEWVKLDRGTVSRGCAIERAAQRTGIDVTTVEQLFSAMLRSLIPVPDVLDLPVRALELPASLTRVCRGHLRHLRALRRSRRLL